MRSPVSPTQHSFARLTRRQANPIHLYPSRDPYRTAAGRRCDRGAIEDRLADAMAMVALDQDQPSQTHFVRLARRELKVRGFTKNTIKSNMGAVRSILRWFGRPPHFLTREHVKNYLEYLFDGQHSTSDISVQLVAIRNVWDKFCFRDVTLGLATPRRKRRQIVVVSRDEVRRILQAAPSLRETLLIGLMYGTGLRVSELARLRWRDIDPDRNQIYVSQGKGNADRHVQLPRQYRELLQRLGADKTGEQYIFPGESSSDRRTNRHLSPRTVQRAVRDVCEIAGIKKHVTPHSFRHAFATHSFEDGCDIRRIQTVLGHVRLETTTIYINVAKQRTDFPSPLDRLTDPPNPLDGDASERRDQQQRSQRSSAKRSNRVKTSVGSLRIHARRDPTVTDAEYQQHRRTQITIEITGHGRRDFLLGTVAELPRVGFATITLPPKETWSKTIQALPKAMQERISQPAFYHKLQGGITAKLSQCENASSEPASAPTVT